MKTKARASCEPGDDRGDVPTGQRMTLRDVLLLNWGSSPAALEGGGGLFQLEDLGGDGIVLDGFAMLGSVHSTCLATEVPCLRRGA